MKKVTREEVIAISNLAMIALTDEEIDRYQKQIESILEYVDILNEVETKEIPVTFQTEEHNVLREDAVKDALSQSDALLNRKDDAINGYFPITSVLSDHE